MLVPPYETPLLCTPAAPALRGPLLSPAASSPAVLLGSLEEEGGGEARPSSRKMEDDDVGVVPPDNGGGDDGDGDVALLLALVDLLNVRDSPTSGGGW